MKYKPVYFISMIAVFMLFSRYTPGSDPAITCKGNLPGDSIQLFAEGIISTGDYESHPCFSPDGKTFYFVKSTPNFSFWTICVSHLENGKWTSPQVASFSGKFSDADPYITPDGKKLFFISNRAVTGDSSKQDMDIWYMNWIGKEWSVPKHLGPAVNSNQSEWFPRLTKSGKLFFGSDREGGRGRTDLYSCELLNNDYVNPQNLGDSINTPSSEFEPLVDYNENFLVFMAVRQNGIGSGDFYISYKEGGHWTKAINMGRPVNTPGTEIGATISPDGKYFFFSSTRETFVNNPGSQLSYAGLSGLLHSPGNGLGDIYFMELNALLKKYKSK